MVISLTGTVDAVPVVFEKTGENLWEVVVPPDLQDGRYFVELTATDDAGNQTYKIADLWIWDGVVTRFEILEQAYTHKLLGERFLHKVLGRFCARFKDYHFICIDRGDKFCIKIS